MGLAAQKHQRFGPYSLIEKIGWGGLGEVFVARRVGETSLCALKRLREAANHHPLANARFKREAHLGCMLNHPNIARIYDAGILDGARYLTTEFVSGVDLLELFSAMILDGYPLKAEISTLIGLEILEALDYAHSATDGDGAPLNLVHRDLSSRNVMVTFDGSVKLIDFGIAKARVDEFKTATGTLLGTPRFMAPEQLANQEVDQRTDLYTLGVVMHELYSGAPLIREDQIGDILRAVMTQIPPPCAAVNPQVPPAVDVVLAQALQKKPEHRFKDAASLRDALYAAHPIDRGSVKKKLGQLLASKFPSQLRQAQTWRAEAQTAGAQEPSSTDTFLPTTTSQTMVQTELMEMGPDGPQKLAQDTMLVTRHVSPPEVAYAPATSTQSGASFSGTPPPGYAVSSRRGLWLGVLALTAGTAVLIALFIIQLNDQPDEVRIPTKRSVQPRVAATPSIRPMIKQVEEPTTPPTIKTQTKTSKSKRRTSKTTNPKRASQTTKAASPSQSRLQARLRKLRRQFNNSGTFEITELVTLLKDAGDQVDRLDPAQRNAPKRLLAQAQSCVSTCTDSEQMLNVAAKLLGALKP